jgi:hypothetical protein
MGPIQVVVEDGNNLVLEVTPTPNTTVILDRGIAGPVGPMGDGDVDGPASSTDNAVARFDGTTGKLIQNSLVTVSDTGAVAGVTTLAASGAVTLSGLTASTALALDASKNVVSVTNTGTGNNVLSNSPTLVTPALGTPASGVVTNLTGTASININGTVGATTANTGAFTTLAASGAVTLSGGTANGVAYLNGSKVLTTGSALTFDGANLALPSGGFNIGASTSGKTLAVLNGDVVNAQQVQLRMSGTNAVLDATRFSGTTPNLIFQIDSSEQMRLTNTGLGIGTSSPTFKLDVQNSAGAGSARIKGGTGANQGAAFYVTQAGSTSTLTAYGDRANIFGGTPDQSVSIFTASGIPLLFDVGGTTKATLDASGRLSLGATSTNQGLLTVFSASGTFPAAGDIGPTNYTTISGASRNGTATYGGVFANTLNLQSNEDIFSSGSGASIGFQGKWNSSAYTSAATFCSIFGGKENGTSGNFAGYLSFATRPNGGNPTERMRLDSSGNLGLGITPSAWGTLRGFDIVGGAGLSSAFGTAYLSSNSFFNGTSWIYKETRAAARYDVVDQHRWYIAPSGTAGNAISFTQAMTLNASGQLLVGTTSLPTDDNNFLGFGVTSAGEVRASVNNAKAAMFKRATSDGTVVEFRKDSGLSGTISVTANTTTYNTSASSGIIGVDANTVAINTNSAERARIDSSGNLLVGLTSATGVAKLQVSGAIRTTGFTVATLPAGTVGMRTYVTDALAPSFGVTVSGGGAVTIPVFHNGTNWIVA